MKKVKTNKTKKAKKSKKDTFPCSEADMAFVEKAIEGFLEFIEEVICLTHLLEKGHTPAGDTLLGDNKKPATLEYRTSVVVEMLKHRVFQASESLK